MRADMSFFFMVDGGSVIRMRERGLDADFDILESGSVRDIMRFAGADGCVRECYEGCGNLGEDRIVSKAVRRWGLYRVSSEEQRGDPLHTYN